MQNQDVHNSIHGKYILPLIGKSPRWLQFYPWCIIKWSALIGGEISKHSIHGSKQWLHHPHFNWFQFSSSNASSSMAIRRDLTDLFASLPSHKKRKRKRKGKLASFLEYIFVPGDMGFLRLRCQQDCACCCSCHSYFLALEARLGGSSSARTPVAAGARKRGMLQDLPHRWIPRRWLRDCYHGPLRAALRLLAQTGPRWRLNEQ